MYVVAMSATVTPTGRVSVVPGVYDACPSTKAVHTSDAPMPAGVVHVTFTCEVVTAQRTPMNVSVDASGAVWVNVTYNRLSASVEGPKLVPVKTTVS